MCSVLGVVMLCAVLLSLCLLWCVTVALWSCVCPGLSRCVMVSYVVLGVVPLLFACHVSLCCSALLGCVTLVGLSVLHCVAGVCFIRYGVLACCVHFVMFRYGMACVVRCCYGCNVLVVWCCCVCLVCHVSLCVLWVVRYCPALFGLIRPMCVVLVA